MPKALISDITYCPLGKKDVEFFNDAESANFIVRIEGSSPLHDIPFNIVGNVLPDKFSDIGTECVPSVFHIQLFYYQILRLSDLS